MRPQLWMKGQLLYCQLWSMSVGNAMDLCIPQWWNGMSGKKEKRFIYNPDAFCFLFKVWMLLLVFVVVSGMASCPTCAISTSSRRNSTCVTSVPSKPPTPPAWLSTSRVTWGPSRAHCANRASPPCPTYRGMYSKSISWTMWKWSKTQPKSTSRTTCAQNPRNP